MVGDGIKGLDGQAPGEAAQALTAILQTHYLRYMIIVSWAVGEPLVAQVDHLRETAATGGKPGVTLTHASGLTATFADAGASLWLASILPGVLFFAILLVVVWLLWGPACLDPPGEP